MPNRNDPQTLFAKKFGKFSELFIEMYFFQDGDYVISILAQESERISVAKFQLRSNELENSDSLSVGMISFLTILAISGVYHTTHTSHNRAGGGYLRSAGPIRPSISFAVSFELAYLIRFLPAKPNVTRGRK
jgi:hypothetical protein